MTFAERMKISSIMFFSLLVFGAAVLFWSSRELNSARQNDVLSDDIQTIVFERATLRDEFFLYGLERARVQWFGLNRDAEASIRLGNEHLRAPQEREVLEKVQADLRESELVSQRLVELLRGKSGPELERAHHDELASRLYSQIMLKDSALQQSSAALQELTRQRYNRANFRTIFLTFAFVLLVVAGGRANAFFINSLLRRRLQLLNEGVARIAAGDFSHRMQCRGSDELALFAGVFNCVLDKVQDYTGQLEKSHDLLSGLSSQVPGILFQACLTPDGLFSTPYVSRGGDELNQGDAAAPLQEPAQLFERLHPEKYQAILGTFRRSAETLEPWEHEFRIDVPDRGMRWLRGQARPMRLPDGGTLWHGFISDITERKRAEEALHRSESRYRMQLQELTNIYTHTAVGLFAVDREMRYLRLNEQMAGYNCRPMDEHVGRTIDEVHPPAFVVALKEMWRPVLERGESLLNLEVQGQADWPSGERHWLVSFQPLFAETGAVIGLTGSVMDITERKVAEQVLLGARQQLEREVQLRTAKLSLTNKHLIQEIEVRKKVEVELLAQQQKLQEMAFEISMAEERERDRIASELHDQVGQRLILAKIKLDSLASNLPLGECEAEAMGVETLIEQTLQDIRSLTFQIRPPVLATAGLEAALRWLGEELHADFGLEVEFSDDGKDKPLRYEVRSTVFQAVRELLLNVAKHAGTKKCRVRFTRVGDRIVIEVEDDGTGLKPGAGDGTRSRSGGFGLLNVQQKVEHLGGVFSIESRPQGGTRAAIEVPVETETK
ncbi:sensor histidine kinase [Citrifermentans bemidjiense Bem]|uniref:Oxygen sensor histidine kinase NreB n=1 Tax=Citrifermentans bemidjiense (strain ATCC BAA-1014 / DSM 16622 / JCM 12645 / Bem) TaxID=404380 RepID=B5EBL0_CITBB|nr:PAS domain-containing protein [Citrifermentans bemidjiense]ACH37479.1 sensor histidine kinase [Citrifermentans bemidjiense Bem]